LRLKVSRPCLSAVKPAKKPHSRSMWLGMTSGDNPPRQTGSPCRSYHPREPVLPLAQGTLPFLRSVRPATCCRGGRRGAASVAHAAGAAAVPTTAQEGKHFDDRTWRRPSPASGERRRHPGLGAHLLDNLMLYPDCANYCPTTVRKVTTELVKIIGWCSEVEKSTHALRYYVPRRSGCPRAKKRTTRGAS